MKICLLTLLGSAVATTTFGPGGCVSTWLDPQSKSCVVRTACTQQAASFASYALRLVCVGHDGGRVLHSFQAGGFDLQETFDTHITCSRCDSGDAAVPNSASPAAASTSLVTVNASELHGLEEEVNLLKSSMVNMAKVVSQLKLEVAESHGTLRGAVPSLPPPRAVPLPMPTVMAAVAPHVPNASSVPTFHANASAPATKLSVSAPVPPELHATARLSVIRPPEINASFVKPVTPIASMPAVAPPVTLPPVTGALSPAAAKSRPRGASFLGVAVSSASSAMEASVALAQKEAEEAAQQAEKDAEAAADDSSGLDSGSAGSVEGVVEEALKTAVTS